MTPNANGVGADPRQVTELLLSYLAVAPAAVWPGADGISLEVAVLSYPEAAAAGHVPCREELARRHPGLGEGLQDFFARRGWA